MNKDWITLYSGPCRRQNLSDGYHAHRLDKEYRGKGGRNYDISPLRGKPEEDPIIRRIAEEKGLSIEVPARGEPFFFQYRSVPVGKPQELVEPSIKVARLEPDLPKSTPVKEQRSVATSSAYIPLVLPIEPSEQIVMAFENQQNALSCAHANRKKNRDMTQKQVRKGRGKK